MVARQLGWGKVEVYDGLTGPDVLARPALVRNLRGLGLPFVPWGHTEASGELSGTPTPAGRPAPTSPSGPPTPSSGSSPPSIPPSWCPSGGRPPPAVRRPG